METAVGRFIIEVAATLGRTPSQVESIVKKLVDEEWFDTIESLKSISDEHWSRLGVPRRLVDAIKNRLDDELPQLKPITPPSTSSNIVLPREPRAELAPLDINESMLAIPASILVDSVKKEIRETVCYDESLPDDAWRDTFVESLKILNTIVGNILTDTSNPKYRQIKSTNTKFQQNIGRWTSAINLLKALGFKLEEESWICSTMYVSRFVEIKTELEKSLRELGTIVESCTFNPFKSSIVNAGDTFGAPNSRTIAEREAELEKLREEAAMVQRMGSDGTLGVALERPRFVRLNGHITKSTFLEVQEDEEDDRSLMLSSMKSIAAAGEVSQKFKSREKMELERIRARQVYDSSRVRILFSDKTALELVVLPKETTQGLYRIFGECLKEKYRTSTEWTLTISPPMRKLQRSSRATMQEEGFLPSVIIRMMMDGQQCAGNVVVSDQYLL